VSPLTVGDAVAVQDARQVCDRLAPRPAAGPWFLVGVSGVAALIGLSPLTLVEFAAVTPLSNLRRAAVWR
jgi:hypothetical protein